LEKYIEVNKMENLIKSTIKNFEGSNDDFGVQVKDARILVVGVGGAGNNEVTRMFRKGISGAETIAVNTDKQHLQVSEAHRKILIGKELTRGLGAGGHPEVGMRAAEESRGELREIFRDVDMVFICTGLGGGTGTGAAPVIAEIAKGEGCIVIGTVTMPFSMEGARIAKAEEGLYRLRHHCDTVIVIENDKLIEIAGELPLEQAFGVADELVTTMIKGITETISKPSLVNLDYADVKAIMHSGGVAVVGYGESNSKNKAKEAVLEAIKHPLLDVSIDGANGALIHVSGGPDMTLKEVNEIGKTVMEHLDPTAPVIWGARVEPELEGAIQVITIITGVKSPYVLGPIEREAAKVQKIEDLGLKVLH
jgi:cell division protein FtsZ